MDWISMRLPARRLERKVAKADHALAQGLVYPDVLHFDKFDRARRFENNPAS